MNLASLCSTFCRRATLAALALTLASCSGIPLRSLPQLVRMQNSLLDARPAELALAIQADARLVPPPGAVPVLKISILPAQAGAFDAVDKALPMQMETTSAATNGLPAAPRNRRWMVYRLSPASQAELESIQAYFRRLKAERKSGGGGTLSVGIAQENLAVRDPALRDTRWQSWLQVSQAEGFFELWSGTLAELIEAAQKGK